MSKAEVSKETLSDEEIASLCSNFSGIALPLREHGVLFGGYSGTSIRVTGADGVKAVLKVCNGYTVTDAVNQAAVARHAALAGFTGVCAPLTLADKTPSIGAPCVVPRPDGTPVMMLSWIDGVAADKVLKTGEVSSTELLSSIGSGLAALHSVPASGATLRECEKGSGACDVAKHISNELLNKMRSSPHTKAHPYLTDFYESECASLKTAMSAEGLPRGILHGDPFLDNMLVSGPQLLGFVDLEDFCLGPLLFDVACCASACCFREDGALDIRRLRALLTGYASVRPLTEVERKYFLPFMRLTMLCNCTWRFINFNIDNRQIESCRDAHVELQDRIVALHEDFTAGAVEGILRSLPKESTMPPPFFATPWYSDRKKIALAAVGGLVAVGAVYALSRRR